MLNNLKKAFSALTQKPRAQKSLGYMLGQGGLDGESGTDFRLNKYGSAFAVTINEALARCVVVRMDAVGALPYRVVDRQGKVLASHDDPEPRHPLIKAIHAYETKHQENFFGLWEQSLAVAGEQYLELIRDDQFATLPVGLRWLNPLNINPETSYGDNIIAFNYQDNGASVRFYPHEIAYDRVPLDMRTNVYGYSSAMTTLNTVGVTFNSARVMQAYFRNNARPGMYGTPKDGEAWNDEEVAQIQRTLRQNKGADNQGKATLFPYPITFTVLDDPDLQKWAELLKTMESSIFLGMGVPRSIAGDSDSTRYQASDSDGERFGRTVVSEARNIQQFVNAVLMPFFNAGGKFEFDLSAYETIDPATVQRVNDAFSKGALTLNQYLEATGFETVPNGDVYYMPMGVTVVPASTLGAQPTAPPQLPAPEPPTPPPSLSTELKRWYDKATGKYAHKALEFVYTTIPDADAVQIRHAIKSGDLYTFKRLRAVYDGNPEHAMTPELSALMANYRASYEPSEHLENAVKSFALGVLHMKALATTRSRFEAEMERLLNRAVEERVTAPVFVRRVTIALDRYARLAYADGYEDGGIQDYELETDDDKWLEAFVDSQITYIKNLADTLYSDAVLTPDEIAGKPQMWWNKSVMPAYNEALGRASKDGLGLYVQGDTGEPCQDCIALDKQKRRMKTWLKYFGGRLPPNSHTECLGFRCACRIVPTVGKKTRGALPPLHGEPVLSKE